MARDHGVGNHARQQRLDGRKDGDGDAVGKLVAEQVQAELGKLQRGQARLDGVQVADGVDLQAKRGHHGGAHDNGHQRTGDALGHLRPHHQNGKAHHAHQHSLPVHRGDVSRQSAQLIGGVDGGGAGGVRQPQQVLDLPDHDGHRNTRCEAGGDRVGNEADKRAELEQAHEHEHHPGNDGGSYQALHAVGGHDARDDGGEGGGGTGDLHAAAAQERDQEARDDSGVKALLRAYARCDGQRDGKRQRHHGHHHARDDVLWDLAAQLLFAGVLDDAE